MNSNTYSTDQSPGPSTHSSARQPASQPAGRPDGLAALAAVDARGAAGTDQDTPAPSTAGWLRARLHIPPDRQRRRRHRAAA